MNDADQIIKDALAEAKVTEQQAAAGAKAIEAKVDKELLAQLQRFDNEPSLKRTAVAFGLFAVIVLGFTVYALFRH